MWLEGSETPEILKRFHFGILTLTRASIQAFREKIHFSAT